MSIIVKISNGLGNQMFQYALGRKLALINKCELKLDFSEYKFGKEKNYQGIKNNLNKFNTSAKEATDADIGGLKIKRREAKFVVEIHFKYSENSQDIPREIKLVNNVYEDTYYISEVNRYKFAIIRDVWYGDYYLYIKTHLDYILISEIKINSNKRFNIKVGKEINSINGLSNIKSDKYTVENDLYFEKLNFILTSPYKIKRKINKFISKKNYYKKRYIKEVIPGDVNVLKAKPPLLLEGGWMNYHYFNDIKRELQKDLTLKEELKNEQFNRLLNEIISIKNSVGIHIRRDYLKFKVSAPVFGVLPLDYYYSALDFINNKYIIDKVFIFADDIKWAKENFRSNYNQKFIEHLPGLYDAHDFELLKNCNHVIIANSTFSWWAAYLKDNEGTVIVAPQRWYLNESYQKHYENNDHLRPANWIYM